MSGYGDYEAGIIQEQAALDLRADASRGRLAAAVRGPRRPWWRNRRRWPVAGRPRTA